MKSSGASYLFTVAVVFGYLHTGTCYKCYTCAGSSVAPPPNARIPLPAGIPFTSSCVDPVDTSRIGTIECSGDTNACVKFTTIVGEVKLVMRGCFDPNDCKSSSDDCHHCTDNLCNSSATAVPSLICLGIISLMFAKSCL